MLLCQLERGEHVEVLGLSVAVGSLAEIDSAEVETQCCESGGDTGVGHRLHHGVEAIAAVQRVGMADHGRTTVLIGHHEVSVEHEVVGGPELHGVELHGRTVPSGSMSGPALNDNEKLPIKMLSDRLLVRIPEKEGERRSSGGILIPATAQISKRLVWAEVVAIGQNVRAAEVGDRVLFSPEDRYEVEVGGIDYIMLRERDIHAVAATRIEASTGLYI